ncbi:MAG: PepSY domain-containing protein [Nitrospina sp.]|nr:PepSY domain-containing protein [Nitrospina sp.]
MRKSRRKIWSLLHQVPGLAAGFILVLVGLTGSCLVFDHRLDEWLNPKILTSGKTGPHRPLDEIVASARKAFPSATPYIFLHMPRKDDGVFIVQLQVPEKNKPLHLVEVMVEPATARVLGSRIKGEDIISIVYDLHWRLLLGDTGRVLVGVLGILMVFSMATGLILWWPAPGRWKRALRFARQPGSKRLNFDRHRLSGVYTAPALFVVLFSGIAMNLPQLVEPVVEWFSPITYVYPEHLRSSVRNGVQPISVGTAVKIARTVFPSAELKFAVAPEKADGFFQATFRSPGEVRKASGSSRVFLDQYSGEILLIQDPGNMTAGDVFLEWQFPLHNGEAFSLPGRIFVCLLGLVPLVLYLTGLRLWKNQLKRGT